MARPRIQWTAKSGPIRQNSNPPSPIRSRIVGVWAIVNADGKPQGEEWSISKDRIVKNPKPQAISYGPFVALPYHPDAAEDPKQIDIGLIKGIYVLDGDELRLCLGGPGKDRPAAFPKKPAPGEVLILHRQKPGAEQPKAKGGPPDAKKVLTPEEAMKQMPKENVTVQFKVASVEVTGWYLGYPATYYVHLKDGGKFTAWLNAHDGFKDDDQIQKLVKKLGIKSVTDLSGKVVRVTGRVDASLRMFVHDPANNVEVVEPTATGPKAKEEQPAKTDQELMVGNWFITNDDSLRKGEMWVIYHDSILMYAKHLGLNAQAYFHRLDAGTNPKQIDITVKRVNGPTIGVIKGIYVLDGDELRVPSPAWTKIGPRRFPKRQSRARF